VVEDDDPEGAEPKIFLIDYGICKDLGLKKIQEQTQNMLSSPHFNLRLPNGQALIDDASPVIKIHKKAFVGTLTYASLNQI